MMRRVGLEGRTGATVRRWPLMMVAALLAGLFAIPGSAEAATTVTPGVPVTVTLTPSSQVQLTYANTLMGRNRWSVTASSLVHADGTAGSASMLRPAAYGYMQVSLGDQPTVIEDDWAAMTATTETVTITADATTSGSLTLVYDLAPDPVPVTLTLGTARTVTMPNVHQNQQLTLPTVAGSRYLLSISNASFTSSNPGGYGVPIYLRGPNTDWIRNGYAPFPAVLDQTTPATAVTYVATATGDATLFVDPTDDTTGQFTVTATLLPDVMSSTRNGVPVTATAVGGSQRLVFTNPGSATGAVPGFHLEPVVLSRIPGRGYSYTGGALADVTLEQNGQLVTTLGSVRNGSVVDFASNPLLAGFDGSKPWQLVVTTASDTIGSVTVRLDLPTVTLRSAPSGKPITLTFAQPSDYARLTIDNRPGQRVLVRMRANTAGATYQLLDAAGVVDQQAWLPTEWQGFVTASPVGPSTLLVQSGGTTGSVEITVLLVTDPVYAFADGQQRTVSWTTEQNPRITFTVPDTGSAVQSRVALEITKVSGTGWGQIQPMIENYWWGAYLDPIREGTPTVLQTGSFSPGSYSILLDPPTPASGSLVVRLRIVTDVSVTAVPGRSVPVVVTTPEQVSTVTVPGPTAYGATRLNWEVERSTLPLTLKYTDPFTGQVTTATLPKGRSEGVIAVTAFPGSTFPVVLTPVGMTTGSFTVTLKAA